MFCVVSKLCILTKFQLPFTTCVEFPGTQSCCKRRKNYILGKVVFFVRCGSFRCFPLSHFSCIFVINLFLMLVELNQFTNYLCYEMCIQGLFF